jgi:glutathione S-transferase
MLKFYYHPLSPIARRVWLALLEKQVPFEPIVVDLAMGEQRQPSYLAINPFQNVPAIVDGEFRVIESLAILDYLEAQYPESSLLPQSSQEIARMRMVIMVAVNEVVPKLGVLAADETPNKSILQQMETVFQFLGEQLGDQAFFGGDRLNLADIVAGATIPLVCRLGVSAHSPLAGWVQRVSERDAWLKTEPRDEDFASWRRWVKWMVKKHIATLSKTIT